MTEKLPEPREKNKKDFVTPAGGTENLEGFYFAVLGQTCESWNAVHKIRRGASRCYHFTIYATSDFVQDH